MGCVPVTMLLTGESFVFQLSVEKLGRGFSVSRRSLDGMTKPPLRTFHVMVTDKSTECVFRPRITDSYATRAGHDFFRDCLENENRGGWRLLKLYGIRHKLNVSLCRTLNESPSRFCVPQYLRE